jgi:hypothetical protein
MARPLVVPFALPNRAAGPQHAVPLGVPQFVVLLGGLLLCPFFVVVGLHPWLDDQLAQRKVLAFRAEFGFDVGEVVNEWGGTYWGFTAITPGGVAERAGLRAEDVPYGIPGLTVHGAVRQARAGNEACFHVMNMRDARAGRDGSRSVCLGTTQTAEPLQPACPLPSPGRICPAPTGGAMLVWREPAVENGRHALILRSPDGAPDVLVRAFDRHVEVLWASDGRAVAITDHDATGESTVWVHWGPLLSQQADVGTKIAASSISGGDRRMVFAQRWSDASTLRLAIGRPLSTPPAPLQEFSYRLDAAARPVP